MSWYFKVLRKYAVFGGRARRKEYWMFFLFNVIIAFALGVLEGIVGIAPESKESVLSGIYHLAILIPSIAVSVRRMHDTDHRGWWILLPIVNLIFLLSDSSQRDNRFGPNPKTAT